jgi:hypothetical protein
MADKKDPKKEALETASIISDALSSIAAQVSDIFANALAGTDKVAQTVTKDIQKRFNDMAKVTDDIASNALKLKDGLIKTDTIEKQILNRKIKQEALGAQLVTLLKQQGVAAGNIEDLIEGQNNGTIKLTKSQKALVNEYAKSKGFNEDYISQLEEQLEKAEEIKESVGVTGKLLKGLSKIPIVGQFIDAEKAVNAANKAAADGAGKIGAMGAAFKNLGGNLLSSLSDPLVSIGLLVKGFKMFLDIGFKADTEITNLSKSMASSKEEATATRDRFIEIQNSGENIFYNTKNLVAAQLELADAFGVTKGFSEAQVKDQILLTKQMGFQAEEAAGIQQLAMSNGMTAREVTGSVIKQTAALAKQTGVQLDNKKVIGEVAKISGQLRLQYANNPALIAKAVIQTQKLGVSLEQAKNMASQLLDFESSIENELSAELLTGKNLNLERARGLALNGDSAAAVEEMAKQVGTAADFTKMNVIQQESLAKAVGMSADELANSLITQENLAKLGSETKKQLEEKAAALRAEGKIDEANKLLAAAGDEEQAQAALERVDAQTTFNQSIETLKSMLSSIVEGPAADFVAWFGDAEKGADRLKGLFESIKTTISIVAGIIAGRMVFGLATSVGSMIAQVALSKKLKAAAQEQAVAEGIVTALKVTGAEASTLGAATPLILGGLAAVMAGIGAYSMMNDGVISPTGGMIVSGPEGSIQLNKKDSIIAGTNLFGDKKKTNDSTTSEKGTINVGGGVDTTAVINAINNLANRPINVSIDGKKVIEATTGNQPNTVGDESRKNSYKMS